MVGTPLSVNPQGTDIAGSPRYSNGAVHGQHAVRFHPGSSSGHGIHLLRTIAVLAAIKFDFDLVTIVEGDFTLPDVATLSTLYGSKDADLKRINNLRGVKSAAVDRLLVALANASTLQELRDAARALDRVVMWSHWQVPYYYAANERAPYWNRSGMPAHRPRFFTLEELNSVMVAWALATWWVRPSMTQLF